MEFTAYILDVLFDSFYPARIRIEDGIFKEVAPIILMKLQTSWGLRALK